MKYWWHLVNVFYADDVPEIKDLFFVKHGSIATRPCLRCFVAKDKINNYPDYPGWNYS